MLINALAVLEPKKSGSLTILDSQGKLSNEEYFRDMAAGTKELREAILQFKNWGFNVNHVTKWGFLFNGPEDSFSDKTKLGTPQIDVSSGDPVFSGSADINFNFYWPKSGAKVRIQLKPFKDIEPQNDKYFFPSIIDLNDPIFSDDKDSITHYSLIGKQDLTEIEAYLAPDISKTAPTSSVPYPNGTHLWQLPYLLGSKAPKQASKRTKVSHYWKYSDHFANRASPYETGENCVVAIVDSGIDIQHPFFESFTNKVSEANIDRILRNKTLSDYREYYKMELKDSFDKISEYLQPITDIVILLDESFKKQKTEFIKLNLHMIINGKTGINDMTTNNTLLLLANRFDESIFKDVTKTSTTAYKILEPILKIIEEKFDLMVMRRDLHNLFNEFAKAKEKNSKSTKELLSAFQTFRLNAMNEIYQTIPDESVPHGSAVVANLLAISPKITWKVFAIDEVSKLGDYYDNVSKENLITTNIISGIRNALDWIKPLKFNKDDGRIKDLKAPRTSIINLSYTFGFEQSQEFKELLSTCEIFNVLLVVCAGNLTLKNSKRLPVSGISNISGLNQSFELSGNWENCIQVGGAFYQDGINSDLITIDKVTMEKFVHASDTAIGACGSLSAGGQNYSDLLAPTICALDGEPQYKGPILDITDGQVENKNSILTEPKNGIWCPSWTKLKWSQNNNKAQHEAIFKPMSGTSFSAPQVSGVAAIIASKFPLFTPKLIVQTLYYSAVPLNKGQSANGLEASKNPGVFRMVHIDRAIQLADKINKNFINTRNGNKEPKDNDWKNAVSKIK